MKDIEKILDRIHKEQGGLMDAQGNFEYPEHEGAYHALCNLEAYIDSLPEEPVSEDLEEAASKAVFSECGNVVSGTQMNLGITYFKAGANWHRNHVWHDSNKEQPIENTTVVIYNPATNEGDILSRCIHVNEDRMWAYIEDFLPNNEDNKRRRI